MISFTLVSTSTFIIQQNIKKYKHLRKRYKMNTLNSITASIVNKINDSTIEDLIDLGFSRERAVKVVTEFDDFDLVQDSIDNTVDTF